MEQTAGRVLQNCCRGSWIRGWVSATVAGLKAAAVAVAVLGLALYIVPRTVQMS